LNGDKSRANTVLVNRVTYVSLFVESELDYPEPRSNATCGSITTILLGIEAKYPKITHYQSTRKIVVLGTNPITHVDEFPLVLNSCITLNNVPYGCRNSTVFRIKIYNPCDTSIIASNRLP